MLDRITPIILTYNEDPNLRRTLSKLSWAKSVLVVDSFSTDDTLAIAADHGFVKVVQRHFDDFSSQLNFALSQAAIQTEWVMVLDADYVLTDELVAELSTLDPPDDVTGYRCSFTYCVDGVPLRGSLYPPSIILFRRTEALYHNDGHAYRLGLSRGTVVDLQGLIEHDDRKPFSRWMASQKLYAVQEAEKLAHTAWSQLPWPDRVRTVPFLAPALVLPYCLLLRRGVLDGRAGAVYAAQRVIAECVLSVELVRRRASRGG